MAYDKVVPQAPIPISQLPSATSVSRENDLLLLTQPYQSVGGRSRKMSVGDFLKYTGSVSDAGVVGKYKTSQTSTYDSWFDTLDGDICSTALYKGCAYTFSAYLYIVVKKTYSTEAELNKNLMCDIEQSVLKISDSKGLLFLLGYSHIDKPVIKNESSVSSTAVSASVGMTFKGVDVYTHTADSLTSNLKMTLDIADGFSLDTSSYGMGCMYSLSAVKIPVDIDASSSFISKV